MRGINFFFLILCTITYHFEKNYFFLKCDESFLMLIFVNKDFFLRKVLGFYDLIIFSEKLILYTLKCDISDHIAVNSCQDIQLTFNVVNFACFFFFLRDWIDKRRSLN